MSWEKVTIHKAKESGRKTLLDEEHSLGARITLKKLKGAGKRLEISYEIYDNLCGLKGFHHISDTKSLEDKVNRLKTEIEKILLIIPRGNERNYSSISNAQRLIYQFSTSFLDEL